MPSLDNRTASASKSRRERWSMCTRITAGPRDGGSYHVAASVTPSSVRKLTRCAARRRRGTALALSETSARISARRVMTRTAPAARSCAQCDQVFADRAIEPDEQRTADQGVADRHFVEMRQRAEEREVREIEIVAGVDAEAELVRQPRHVGISLRSLRWPDSALAANARANGSV